MIKRLIIYSLFILTSNYSFGQNLNYGKLDSIIVNVVNDSLKELNLIKKLPEDFKLFMSYFYSDTLNFQCSKWEVKSMTTLRTLFRMIRKNEEGYKKVTELCLSAGKYDEFMNLAYDGPVQIFKTELLLLLRDIHFLTYLNKFSQKEITNILEYPLNLSKSSTAYKYVICEEFIVRYPKVLNVIIEYRNDFFYNNEWFDDNDYCKEYVKLN